MFRRIISELQDFFGLTPKQARATLFTIFVMILLAGLPFVFNRYLLPLIPITEPAWAPNTLDSLAAEIRTELKTTDNSFSSRPYPDRETKPKVTINRFPFNPNTATVPQLEALGIPSFLARRIDKYRQKGGQFRRKTDLRQIYDFPSSLYTDLEPYILLPSAGNATPSKSPAPAFRPDANPSLRSESSTKTFTPKRSISIFDLNTADSSQLLPLKGIGSKLALRIIKFRDALGGFHHKDQYKEIYGLDSLALDELARYTHLQDPVQKVAINQATAEQLYAHPYLRNRKLTSVIVNYRNQHGPYHSMEDLQKIGILDIPTANKIAPYLSFE